jgi:phospholipid N-methyltransferase
VKIQMQINKLNILGKFIFSIPILTITVLLIGDIFTSYKNHVLLEFITQQKWRILLSFFLYSFAVYFTYLIYKIARNTKDLQLELFKLVSATEESPIDLNLKTSDYENALSFYDEYHLGAQKIGPLLKGMTLEIGAGTGLFTQLVLKENTQIDKLICIDPNRENILECIKKNLQYNTKKQKPYYVTLGYDNFLSSGLKFDTIYSSLVWHHIPESNKYDFVAQQFDSIGINGKVFIFDVFTSDDPNKVVDEKGALIEFHNKRINGIINSNDENANYFFNENVDYNRLRDFALSMELKAFTDGLNEIGEYKISFYKANTIINKLKLKYKFQMSVECLNQITEEKIFRGYILLKFSGISVIDAMVSSK